MIALGSKRRGRGKEQRGRQWKACCASARRTGLNEQNDRGPSPPSGLIDVTVCVCDEGTTYLGTSSRR